MAQLATLTTERLTLKPLAVADAQAMVGIYADERMYPFTGGSPPTAVELCQRYERLVSGWSDDGRQQWCNWIIMARSEPIGVLQATIADDHEWAAVAWEIGVDHQGNGCASEATRAVIDWLIACGVKRITATIHPDHMASASVARKAGLTATDVVDGGEVVWQISGS